MIFRNSMAVSFLLCFLFFLSSHPQKALSFHTCRTAYLPQLIVQFPFAVDSQSDRCVYPGFNLTSSGKTPTISLPFSGNFAVTDINYSDQLISLSDPDRCLPDRILTLNLTSSPFSSTSIQNYTFLNCTEPVFPVRDAVAVACLSGRNFTVYLTSTESAVEQFVSESVRCRIIKSVSAPIMTLPSETLTGFDSGTAFMQLSWNVPDCRRCVYSVYRVDGVLSDCVFKHESGLEVDCDRYVVGKMAFKLFFATILGLILGVILFGCLVQGCIRACNSVHKGKITPNPPR